MRHVKLIGDFLNSNKILFHFARTLEEYLEGRRAFSPVSVEIHPTAMCNHRCVHCSYTERNEKRTTLPQSVMERLADSIADMGVRAVYFSGGGEPALYPNIASYAKQLFNNGLEVSLITNGSYLEESGIFSIAHVFNYIAVSVPSTDAEKYMEITGRTTLGKVMAVPRRIKLEHGEKAPVIGARVVVTNKIFKDVINILQNIHAASFDYALFKIVRDYEDRGFGLSDEETATLRCLIENNQSLLDDDFTNLHTIFDYKSVPLSNRCFINEMGLIANVDSDGLVYPNITEIGQSRFCIGDLNKNTLEEIWNSTQHESVKQASNEKCAKGQCENCRAIAYNFNINSFLDKLPGAWDNFI